MTTSRFMNAMEYIGDDLIERAAADMERPPQPAAIWTKGLAIAASLVLIVGGACYVGIWYWGEHDTNSANTNESSDTIVPGPSASLSSLITMENLFRYYENGVSFSKLKIDEIDEKVYKTEQNTDSSLFMLIKCTVVEDYYDIIENGTDIVLKIYLIKSINEGKAEYLSNQSVIEFFSHYEYIFAYFDSPVEQEGYLLETDERYDLFMTPHLLLFSYHILPISEGKLDLHALRAFWEEEDTYYPDDSGFSDDNFWRYVQDGLDESVFAEYIRENKERQMGGKQES